MLVLQGRNRTQTSIASSAPSPTTPPPLSTGRGSPRPRPRWSPWPRRTGCAPRSCTVGHDLRTPLAAAKASVTSLHSSDVDWPAADQDELLATADEALDRLTRLVDNLLDLSRLEAGVLPVVLRPTSLDEVVSIALHELGPNSARVLVDIPHTLPQRARKVPASSGDDRSGQCRPGPASRYCLTNATCPVVAVPNGNRGQVAEPV